jgi:hypothetical protein|tara:strand:- start:276 stop:467 length:192 start_codon:yes stop_codon:yes gene_type:complete
MADHIYRTLAQRLIVQQVHGWLLGNVGILDENFAHSLFNSYSNYFVISNTIHELFYIKAIYVD